MSDYKIDFSFSQETASQLDCSTRQPVGAHDGKDYSSLTSTAKAWSLVDNLLSNKDKHIVLRDRQIGEDVNVKVDDDTLRWCIRRVKEINQDKVRHEDVDDVGRRLGRYFKNETKASELRREATLNKMQRDVLHKE